MKIPKKHNPFTTPEDYFDEFSQDLTSRLSQEKINLSKKTGFKVPEDYFEMLSLEPRKQVNTAKPKVIPFRPKKFYYVAVASVAAAFLIFFGLQWYPEKDTSWDTIANTDIENYFKTNGLTLTSYEIAELIPLDDLEMTDFIETELQEEFILNYIDEQIDDLDELNLKENE